MFHRLNIFKHYGTRSDQGKASHTKAMILSVFTVTEP